MRDPELVARAQNAATRLETAWERWRAAQGLAETPAQPVVGYVGYALKEPWGQPRAVIGFSADEAERLAEHLESGTATVTPLPARSPAPKTAQSVVEQWSGASAGKPAPAGKPAKEPRPAEPEAAVTADQALLATDSAPASGTSAKVRGAEVLLRTPNTSGPRFTRVSRVPRA